MTKEKTVLKKPHLIEDIEKALLMHNYDINNLNIQVILGWLKLTTKPSVIDIISEQDIYLAVFHAKEAHELYEPLAAKLAEVNSRTLALSNKYLRQEMKQVEEN